MKRYWKYIRPYLPAFIIGPICMIIEVIGEVVMPLLLKQIVDVGVDRKDVPYIIIMGIFMVVTAFLMMAGGIGGAYFSVQASSNFANDLRQDIFKKVQEFSFANIDKFSTGSLVTRLTNDITQVQNELTMILRMMLRAPGMMIGALCISIAMNPRLAMIILIVIPLLTISIVLIIKISFPRFQKMQRKLDNLNSNIQENITNVRVVKSFVREGYESEKFDQANSDLVDSTLHAMKVVITTMPVMTLAMNVTTIAVVWFGGNQIIAGEMKTGSLIAFTTYIVQILMSLMMVSMVILNGSRALASLRRITEVLDETVDLTDEKQADCDMRVTRGKVEFRNVGFRYYKNTKELVLDKINFTANPGETIGIIGSTGSGKSSLVQMIPRLYDADEGEVLVDDRNVKEYTLKNLREGVGMVLQKNVLFSGTIEENLLWGNDDANEEEIRQAAVSAQADGFVQSFTEGYQTELGQGGVNVSGGQKQRLCIARALLKQPKILILDDSTSAVDTATEAKIRESFSTTLKDTTKFIIAQRISSVMEADQIIVLDDGVIVGMGNHQELLENCEAYREIYDSQMEKEATA